MTDFTKLCQPPSPEPPPKGPEVAPLKAAGATFQLTFAEKFVTAFKMSFKYFIFYVPVMLVSTLMTGLTLGLLGPAALVGISTSALRQIDGDPGRPTFRELLSPFNRTKVMLLLGLVVWGFGLAYIVFMAITGLFAAIPVVGVLFALAAIVLPLIIQAVFIIFMAAAALYLAEYDDTATNAISRAYHLIKNNIGQWLSGFLAVLIVQVLAAILVTFCGLVILAPVFLAASSSGDFQHVSIGLVIMVPVGLLIMLVSCLFPWLFSLFAYGLSYRQCIPAGQTPAAPNNYAGGAFD